MHFVIHCLDAEGVLARRLELYDAHKAYLAQAAVKTVISGPLLGEDRATMCGSMFMVEADSRAVVEAFNAADPYRAAGIWKQISIHPFHLRVDNR